MLNWFLIWCLSLGTLQCGFWKLLCKLESHSVVHIPPLRPVSNNIYQTSEKKSQINSKLTRSTPKFYGFFPGPSLVQRGCAPFAFCDDTWFNLYNGPQNDRQILLPELVCRLTKGNMTVWNWADGAGWANKKNFYPFTLSSQITYTLRTD